MMTIHLRASTSALERKGVKTEKKEMQLRNQKV